MPIQSRNCFNFAIRSNHSIWSIKMFDMMSKAANLCISHTSHSIIYHGNRGHLLTLGHIYTIYKLIYCYSNKPFDEKANALIRFCWFGGRFANNCIQTSIPFQNPNEMYTFLLAMWELSNDSAHSCTFLLICINLLNQFWPTVPS